MIILENDFIKASFSPIGAELQSLIWKQTNENYLWKGDKNFWGKFSPILFPIVGALRDGTYVYKENEYHLSRHGFARDHEFTSEQVNDAELLFSFQHSAETLQVYPFEFHLSIRYKLEGNSLSCGFEINNPSETNQLLFSIGGHPAFAVTTNAEIAYADYYLEFNHDEELIYHAIDHDLIKEETTIIPLKKGILPLKYELFYQDALVFKSLKSDVISLRNHKNDRRLDFKFDGFPYFGIWAAKNADFVCLEPWCGIADLVDHNQELTEKEGIISLNPGEHFSRTWSVSIS